MSAMKKDSGPGKTPILPAWNIIIMQEKAGGIRMSFVTIRARDIFRYLKNGRGLLVDLRQQEKYCAGHIPGAVNIPYEELQDRMQEIKQQLAEHSAGRMQSPAIVYCDRGNTSLLAARDLYRAGISVLNVYGGFFYYRGPVVKGCSPN